LGSLVKTLPASGISENTSITTAAELMVLGAEDACASGAPSLGSA
jgi:hypothetical protein